MANKRVLLFVIELKKNDIECLVLLQRAVWTRLGERQKKINVCARCFPRNSNYIVLFAVKEGNDRLYDDEKKHELTVL